MSHKPVPVAAIFTALALVAAISAVVGFLIGYITAEVDEARTAHAMRALPVSWSSFGTCGAEALGTDFVRWTCRIEQ